MVGGPFGEPTCLEVCVCRFGGLLPHDRCADAQSLAEPVSVKSEIYFGSDMGAGQIVSQQAWEKFLSEVVMRRFPAGLTVLEALGKGTTGVGQLTRIRVLIVVHPSGRDAEARLPEIKIEYKRRFGSAG